MRCTFCLASHIASVEYQVTVWFDGNCPICLKEIALMRHLDKAGRINFVNAANNSPLNCPINRESLLARFHAKEGDTIHSGAAAFAAMWRAIPMLRPLGLLARIPGMIWVMDRFYTFFLRIRPLLQKLVRK